MAWARSATCSLVKMLETWLRTVFWLSPSLVAITGLARPWATRSSTSRSRSVSCGNTGAGALDGGADLLLVGALEQVTAGAGAQRGEDRVVVVEHGQHEHLDVRTVRHDATGGLDAVQPRHVQVHDDHVRLGLPGQLDGLGPAGGGPGELGVRAVGQQGGQAVAEQRVIVGDQDPDRFGHSCSRPGRWALILVPCGRLGSITRSPPSSVTRSRIDAMPTPARQPSGRPTPSSQMFTSRPWLSCRR